MLLFERANSNIIVREVKENDELLKEKRMAYLQNEDVFKTIKIPVKADAHDIVTSKKAKIYMSDEYDLEDPRSRDVFAKKGILDFYLNNKLGYINPVIINNKKTGKQNRNFIVPAEVKKKNNIYVCENALELDDELTAIQLIQADNKEVLLKMNEDVILEISKCFEIEKVDEFDISKAEKYGFINEEYLDDQIDLGSEILYKFRG